MSLTKRVGLVVGAATLSLTGAAFGETTGASDQDLQARIADLEAQVAKMKAQESGDWMTESRAAEIRSLVQDVLQDADTRASLLQGGVGAGYDGLGFYIGSQDGNFRLNVRGQMQFRYMFNMQDDGFGSDTSRGGFENSRTKLRFDGHVVNPDWTYAVEGNFSNAGGAFGLEDAWINYDFNNGWGLRFGQFKLPGLREEAVHSSMQQAVERSLINGTFTLDRSQGLMLHYSGEQFRFAVAFSDGARGLNSASLGYDTEYAFSGRAEVLFSGTWDQFDDFSSWRGEDFGFLLGGGFHYQDGEYGTPATEVQIIGLTIDGSLEFGGANLFASFVWTDIDSDTAGGIDANPWGAVVQGGIFLTEDWELFARFEYGDSDDIFTASAEELMILTVGVNHFISGNHDLKWTTDIGYAFDEVDPAFTFNDAGIAGWRADASGQDGQFVIRTQLQLLF